MWAVGCVVYSLLSGFMFGDREKLPVSRWRFKKFFATRLSDIKFRSDDARSFIKSIMRYTPKNRLSPTDALSQKWMIQKLVFDKHRSREEEKRLHIIRRLTQ
mgnify:FL=1